ncbi:unnamed protein product [Diabrotica balteata]|uniref:Ankyrin n=1 Tax=Diabrotica balteata TaxID=107213 RepID=A0A9N9SYU0_DIABA|nr:unnamed protein product [Diabrotica balteata]
MKIIDKANSQSIIVYFLFQTDPNTAFLRAVRAGQLDKIIEYLDSGTVRDINTSNANGLNALHLASKDGHIEIARELLKRGAIPDAATKKGNTSLHIASLAGQEEIVRLLVQHGASLNVQSQNGFTPLYMAAQENHDGCVRYLLSKGANQALATEDGFTPLAVAMQQGHDKVVAVLLENDTRGKVRLPALHIAAKKDDVKAATLLLQNEHNPDVTSKSGFTPLHIAAHYGNDKVALLLYEKGADVNYTAKHNITPLHVASKWGKINMVTLLVAKGADIQAKTRDGLTPLHCAARSGHDHVVDLLLENGAPMHAKTKNGLAPLHMAAQGEHVDAARVLLYHGAPVDEVTVDYLTALHVAAHCGHVRVAKLLLDRGADPNARALNGFTPLHIACKKNRIKVVELLLKHGASIGATTESGLTPLHVASFMGCMNIVIYLLQHDASPDIPTVRGETPLHLAARANQTDIIRILLRNGAAVDAKAREEQTPLHVASRLGNVDIVMLLLQHGAQPQATTKDLYTPLHIAAKEGQEEVASVLLDNGADLTATTKKGFTPLHLASKYGHLNVARLLLQRDAPADAQGKNGVTPLHVAAHYDHQPVALLLLDKGASPHATAKNGHTPLHIAARKNQNGLTPVHLCAQEDRVAVAQLLLRAGAQKDAQTKQGYTPLHVACHHGHVNMVRLLIDQGADVNPTTVAGYTPLHQAAQQGHVLVITLLLKNKADPNALTNNGQTALGIANKLGYISVVEELKVVTETNITTSTTINIEEKYKVVAPEAMQETFMSDSEDEGGDDPLLDQQQYKYMTVDDMKSYGDDSMRLDVTNDEKSEYNRNSIAPSQISNDIIITPQHVKEYYATNAYSAPDNVDINRQPITVGSIAEMLEDINLKFGLTENKIVGTVTDNGSNFVKAFKVFGEKNEEDDDEEIDEEENELQILHLEVDEGKELEDQDIQLPKHMRCATHTLNLIATTDYKNTVINIPTIRIREKNAFSKCAQLWKKSNKPKSNEVIIKILGHTLSSPGATRWNSTFDAVSQILQAKEKLPILLQNLTLEPFKETELLYLEEYCLVMKPLALTLDLLQGEENVSFGYLLPSLISLINKYEKLLAQTKLKYGGEHLAKMCIKSLNTRFANILNLEWEDPIIAAVLLPKFKLKWYNVVHNPKKTLEDIKKCIITVAKKQMELESCNESDESGDQNLDDFFDFSDFRDQQVDNSCTITYNEQEQGSSVNNKTSKIQLELLRYLEDKRTNLQILNEYPTLKRVSTKYNTCLPSSAPVERLFSFATMIDTPKRKALSDEHFERPCPTSFDSVLSKAVKTSGCVWFGSIPGCRFHVNATEKTFPGFEPQAVVFLVSFIVDARGGAMRGCRHSGVRVIVPPRCASSPTRITCRYVRPQRTPTPPPLMEGEALASRLLELGPVGAKFLGPVIIEVPHFASLRGKQREIIVLRSDNGETWKEHTLEASEEAIQDVLNHSFDGEELSQIEDLHTSRITRILTNDFPHYFAVISRIRQEVHAIGPDGGTVSSIAVPLVQAVFPPNALTKKIRVGLQAQAIEPELVSKLLGHGVAVSPIVTVEPRRRKFHKAITLSMPAPKAHSQGMINQYQGASNTTLRLLCSITGGQNKAVWEDVTGSTPLTFVKDCVSFTTTVSARFWLMDCRNVADAARMATELYNQAMHVPFMAKFVVFAKRVSPVEARVRVFCMTDDKEDKTLEHQENFTEIAKSRDIEVLEGKDVFMEFGGNIVPVLQSGDQPKLGFKAFRENRLAFTVRLRDQDEESTGRIIFMSDAKVARGEPNQTPLCTLNLVLPKDVIPSRDSQSDLLSLDKDHSYLLHGGISKPDTIHRADFRLTDICNLLDDDWEKLALELDIPPSDIDLIKEEYPENHPQQAMIMFRLWLRQKANKATGNKLEQALNKIGRQDIVNKCICNVELVTDDMEKALAKIHLDQSGFENLKEELGPSRDASLRRDAHVDKSFQNSQDELDKSEKVKKRVHIENHNAINKAPPANEPSEPIEPTTPVKIQNEAIEEITQQLNQLHSTPKISDPHAGTPPPSPAEFGVAEPILNSKHVLIDESAPEDCFTYYFPKGTPNHQESEPAFSTPFKIDHPDPDPIATLKKNVHDTLTFLHQERNDFLPEDDIIIPSRKDDHISKKINLDSIHLKTPKRSTSDYDDSFRETVESEVDDVIKEAEEVVNNRLSNSDTLLEEKFSRNFTNRDIEEKVDSIFDDVKTNTEDSLDNLESLKDDSISIIQEKSEEAFKFLENEASSPLTSKYDDSRSFIEREIEDSIFDDVSQKSPKTPRSSIPVAKPRKSVEKERSDIMDERAVSPTDPELLSKIPVVKGGKIKTIKKHSKDPLKEFVTLSRDVNWDDDLETDKIIETVTTDPIVKTTVTRITTETTSEPTKSKIPIPHPDALNLTSTSEPIDLEASPKSKIPVLRTETTRINSPETVHVEKTTLSPDGVKIVETTTTIASPGSKVSTKSSTLDSESDDDSRRSPLKGILKKTTVRTIGSSSGSDIALHEEGAELSEDDSESIVIVFLIELVRCLEHNFECIVEDFYQQEPQFSIVTQEVVDPVTGAKTTRTIKTATQVITSPLTIQNESDLRHSMQTTLDQFMEEERHPH